MPHQQIRSNPRLKMSNQRGSTPDVAGVLRVIQGQTVNILGIAGSDHELDGEVGLLVSHADFDAVFEAVQAEYPETYRVGSDQHLHLDWTEHETGGLLSTLKRARQDHPNSHVRDILVMLDPTMATIDENDRLVLDDTQEPVPGDRKVHLVQIYFIPGPAGR